MCEERAYQIGAHSQVTCQTYSQMLDKDGYVYNIQTFKQAWAR